MPFLDIHGSNKKSIIKKLDIIAAGEQPTGNKKENTLWINTKNKISNIVLCNEIPDRGNEGELYVLIKDLASKISFKELNRRIPNQQEEYEFLNSAGTTYTISNLAVELYTKDIVSTHALIMDCKYGSDLIHIPIYQYYNQKWNPINLDRILVHAYQDKTQTYYINGSRECLGQ